MALTSHSSSDMDVRLVCQTTATSLCVQVCPVLPKRGLKPVFYPTIFSIIIRHIVLQPNFSFPVLFDCFRFFLSGVNLI